MNALIPVLVLGFFVFLVVRKLASNYRVNRVIYSGHGKRYLDNLEQTGIAVDRQDLNRLTELAVEREEMHATARQEGYDLDLVDAYFESRFGMMPDQLIQRDIEMPVDRAEHCDAGGHEVGSGNEWPPGLIEDLHAFGHNGIELLRETMEDLRPQLKDHRNDVRLRLQYFLHAHALVWYAVSLTIPVEIGAKIWEVHLGLLRKNLVDQGFDATIVDGLEPALRTTWLRYAESKERGRNPSTAHYSIILEDFLGSPRNVIALTAVASVVTAIMDPCRRALENGLPAYVDNR